jgi:hypothetical protein
MRDFVNWCSNGKLIDVFEDGTIAWKEAAIRSHGKISRKEPFKGGRDGRDDLSDDYKDHCHMMGTVWPYKVVQSGKSGKAVAPVGK